MKRTITTAALLLLAATAAFAEFAYEGQWGKQGSREGQFDHPWDVAVADGGRVFVVDRHNHRIQYFAATGSYRGTWGSYGTAAGKFRFPSGVVASANGVYVGDSLNHRVNPVREKENSIGPSA